MAFNRFDIAREAFLKAARLDPASAYVQFMLGFFYYVDNDFSKAVPALETAARLNHSDSRPLLYLAMSQEGLAHPDLALELYEKTISLEAKTGDAYRVWASPFYARPSGRKREASRSHA